MQETEKEEKSEEIRDYWKHSRMTTTETKCTLWQFDDRPGHEGRDVLDGERPLPDLDDDGHLDPQDVIHGRGHGSFIGTAGRGG